MTGVLFPYPTLDADPALGLPAVRVDGVAKPRLRDPEAGCVNLFDHDRPWRRAELGLELTVTPAAVEAFEAAHGPLAAVAVAHCLPTNHRQPVRLTRSPTDPGRWSGVLEVDRDSVRDRVRVDTTLTAAVGGVSHRPVGSAPTWVVYADKPESLRRAGTLPVKWLDFTRPGPDGKPVPEPARDFPKATHVVAFPGGLPEVWLNSGFDGLEPLLRDRRDRRGTDKGLHDFQRTGIARGVWLALVADALAAVRGGDDGEPPDWPAVPWRAEVLRLVLPEVAPDKPERELLEMAAGEWRTADGAGAFFARAEAVVGNLVKANEVLRRYIQNHGREGEA